MEFMLTQLLGSYKVEIIGILLYLSGSFINTHSEYYRHAWKLKEENKGRLYAQGLFSLAMHINYSDDILVAMSLRWGFTEKLAYLQSWQNFDILNLRT
jgi:steroid 5-alpha reductase family enzyme